MFNSLALRACCKTQPEYKHFPVFSKSICLSPLKRPILTSYCELPL